MGVIAATVHAPCPVQSEPIRMECLSSKSFSPVSDGPYEDYGSSVRFQHLRCSSLDAFKLVYERGKDHLDIPDNTIVGEVEDFSLGVGIDGYNTLAVDHAGRMLYGT